MLSTAVARALLLSASLASGLGRGAAAPADVPGDPTQETGRALAEELGCGACHQGMPRPDVVRRRAPALGPGASPLSSEFVFTYLADPVRRRTDIGSSRMPDFRLDEAERVALALFLGTPSRDAAGPFATIRDRHPEASTDLGRRVFGVLGCAGCHAGVEGATPIVAPDLSREGVRVTAAWLSGFVAHPTVVRGDGHPTLAGARMPDFRLDETEAAAMTSYLTGLGRRFATLDTTTLTPFERDRTQRFLEDRLACLGCHRVGGAGGGIGPSLDGLADRLEPSFVLEMVLDPQRAAPGGPMPRQPMPAREASRLARYLLDLGGAREAPARASLADPGHPAWATPADTARGAVLYARHCAACHGPEGRADGWNAPNLPVPPAAHADSARMSARADDTLFDGIWAGAWVLDGSPRMPAFGGLLSTDDVRALVGWIRRLCGCSGPAWSRDGRGAGR